MLPGTQRSTPVGTGAQEGFPLQRGCFPPSLCLVFLPPLLPGAPGPVCSPAPAPQPRVGLGGLQAGEEQGRQRCPGAPQKA